MTTPAIKTSKGIRVGYTKDKVFEKYGEVKYYDTSETTGYYEYRFESKILKFFVDEKGKVKGIRYDIV